MGPCTHVRAPRILITHPGSAGQPTVPRGTTHAASKTGIRGSDVVEVAVVVQHGGRGVDGGGGERDTDVAGGEGTLIY